MFLLLAVRFGFTNLNSTDFTCTEFRTVHCTCFRTFLLFSLSLGLQFFQSVAFSRRFVQDHFTCVWWEELMWDDETLPLCLRLFFLFTTCHVLKFLETICLRALWCVLGESRVMREKPWLQLLPVVLYGVQCTLLSYGASGFRRRRRVIGWQKKTHAQICVFLFTRLLYKI